MTTLWLFAHHCLAHPLLFLSAESRWATRFHDWTADNMGRPGAGGGK